MDIDLLSLTILLLLAFIASFLNAIVGGGGLISLPALMAVGLPQVQPLPQINWPIPLVMVQVC